jgi:hypothetical protein
MVRSLQALDPSGKRCAVTTVTHTGRSDDWARWLGEPMALVSALAAQFAEAWMVPFDVVVVDGPAMGVGETGGMGALALAAAIVNQTHG